MDTNEIMVNEEVVAVVEKVAEDGFKKGFGGEAVIGLAFLAGIFACEYIAKPIWAKIKAKKDQKAKDATKDNVKDIVIVEEFEEDK